MIVGLAVAVAAFAAATVSGGVAQGRGAAARARPAATPQTAIMVVGRAKTLLSPRQVRPAAAVVALGRHRCAVPAGTPLAALLATRARVTVTDASGCDPTAMFVTSVGGEHNHGAAGWEYKLGHRDPSFGAGDPGGRLHAGQQLLWYWCVRAGDCERTLTLSSALMGSTLHVHVLGEDENGHQISVAGATVHYGGHTAVTDGGGHAAFAIALGVKTLYATKQGLVRSFPTTVGAVP